MSKDAVCGHSPQQKAGGGNKLQHLARGAVGLIIVAAGIGIAVKGLTASSEKDLQVHGPVWGWIVPLGTIGLVFVIVGGFFGQCRPSLS
jgi:hypothetical protein